MADFFNLLDSFWIFATVILAFLLMILLNIEIKGVNFNLDLKEDVINSDYLEKHKKIYVDDQYVKFRQFFDLYSYFSTNLYDPIKIILRYHRHFKQWLIFNYSFEVINESAINSVIRDPNLKLFLNDPIEWFRPYFIPQKKHFYNKQDDASIAIGIAKLVPAFKELEKMIFFHLDIPFSNTNWTKYESLERKFIFNKYKKTIRNISIIVVVAIILWINSTL